MNAEDVVMRAVTEGWFSVREDGTIWRVAQRRKTRDGVVTVEQLETPHRVDSPMSAGYLGVKFMVDGKQVYCLAHRLVWRVFKGPIPSGMTVNHKNGNKHCNRLSNLELLTRAANTRHMVRVLRRGRRRGAR